MLTFDDILAPLGQEEFLAGYWDQRYVHIAGCCDKFTALLPWDRLNAILTEHRLPAPRLLLFRGGHPLPPDRYQDPVTGRVRTAKLLAELDAGATLIVNHVDEAVPEVGALTSAIRSTLCVPVHVNIYASWRHDNGFAVHFDHQETLILQLHGRKKWQVWVPTRLHPLRPDVEEANPPDTLPVWDGLLEQGAALYMPRGWWHVAYPVGEASLHLTITIEAPNGVNLLRWLTAELRSSVLVRQNLPLAASRGAHAEYIEAMRRHVLAVLTPDVIERYIVAHNHSGTEGRLCLPDVPTIA